MQQIADKDVQGQAPAGENGGAPDPLAALEELSQKLDREITELQDKIGRLENGLKTANADVERERGKKKELDARKANLGRLVDGYKSDQQKIAQQRQASEQDAQAAWQLLNEVRDELEQELSEEYRQAIQEAIEAVDDRIDELSGNLNAKQSEVHAAEEALAAAKAASTRAEADVRQAQNDLRGLPGKLQSLSAQVKRMQGTLQGARDKGQTTETLLLAVELAVALDELERHLDPGHERRLAQQVQEAWTAYNDARNAVPTAEDEVKRLRGELEQIQKDLKDYTDNRRKKIEARIEARDEEPPANGEPAEGKVEVEVAPALEGEQA